MVSKRSPVKKRSRRSPVKKNSPMKKHNNKPTPQQNEKEMVMSRSRAAKQCVRSGKCSDGKQFDESIDVLVRMLECILNKDLNGLTEIMLKTNMHILIGSFGDIKAVEKQLMKQDKMNACIMSTCFKEITELMMSLQQYLHKFHPTEMKRASNGFFELLISVVKDIKEKHADLYTKLRNGAATAIMIKHKTGDDMASIKSFIGSINTLTPSENQILFKYYELLAGLIATKLPEFFVIVKEVSDVMKA